MNENQSFSYADAEKLTALLLEQSKRSKSVFFCRRPKRSLSDGCLLENGFDVPTSTPDTLFLSRYSSLMSTASTQPSFEACGVKAPVVDGCSASEEIECQLDLTVPESPKPADEEAETANEKSLILTTVSPVLPPQPESTHASSFGSIFANWSRNMLQDIKGIKTPLYRREIRWGKQPAGQMKVLLPVPPQKSKNQQFPHDVLNDMFQQPSSSTQFKDMKLAGGTGPPGFLSEDTLDELDQLDREQARIKKELAAIEKRKAELLRQLENNTHVEHIFTIGRKPRAASSIKTKKEKDERRAVKLAGKVTWLSRPSLVWYTTD